MKKRWDWRMEKVWNAMEDAYLNGWRADDIQEIVLGNIEELIRRYPELHTKANMGRVK